MLREQSCNVTIHAVVDVWWMAVSRQSLLACWCLESVQRMQKAPGEFMHIEFRAAWAGLQISAFLELSWFKYYSLLSSLKLYTSVADCVVFFVEDDC